MAVAGRVMTRRVMGKLAFVTLRDDSGTIQLYVDKSRLEDGADAFKELKGLIDAGDFVGVRGGLRRTDRGELSVVVKNLQVRAPCCVLRAPCCAAAWWQPCALVRHAVCCVLCAAQVHRGRRCARLMQRSGAAGTEGLRAHAHVQQRACAQPAAPSCGVGHAGDAGQRSCRWCVRRGPVGVGSVRGGGVAVWCRHAASG